MTPKWSWRMKVIRLIKRKLMPKMETRKQVQIKWRLNLSLMWNGKITAVQQAVQRRSQKNEVLMMERQHYLTVLFLLCLFLHLILIHCTNLSSSLECLSNYWQVLTFCVKVSNNNNISTIFCLFYQIPIHWPVQMFLVEMRRMQERMKELEQKLLKKESKSSVPSTSPKEPVKMEAKSPVPDVAPSRKVRPW